MVATTMRERHATSGRRRRGRRIEVESAQCRSSRRMTTGLRPRQQGEVPAQSHRRLVPDALRFGRDTSPRRRSRGRSRARSHDVGGADGLLALSVSQGEPGLELLRPPRVGRSRRFHPGGDDVAGERVRAVLLDVGSAPAEPPDHLGLSREPEVEAAQQPALADPGVTDDVDDEVPTLVDDVEEPLLEEPDLTDPAHRARLDALDDAELVEPEPAWTFDTISHASTGTSRPLSSRPGTECTLNARRTWRYVSVDTRTRPPAPRTAVGWRG